MDARVCQLGDDLVERGCRGPFPGEPANPVRPRIEADGQPVPGDREARAQPVRGVRDRPQRHDDARRAGRERQLDLLDAVDAAGKLQRDGDGARDLLDRRRGLPGGRPRAPSRSTRWIRGAPASTNQRQIRSGRSVGVPVPVAAPGHHTSRDRPASRSRLGMTCIRRGRAVRVLVVRTDHGIDRGWRWRRSPFCSTGHRRTTAVPGQEAPVEADRDAARVEQRVVEARSENSEPRRARSSSRSRRSMTLPSR